MADDKARMPVRDRMANVRVDTDGERHILGVVSSGYEVVHNVEALVGFSHVVRQAGAKFTRAGTIDRGRIAYAFADLPEPVEILPGDPVKRSLMLTNSFDGSTPLAPRFRHLPGASVVQPPDRACETAGLRLLHPARGQRSGPFAGSH